ncbi:MAG: DMT family transporter [Methylacidiphilales bacterium]|nr:DMT family transporter [Candidatus Methylacidiphilales bacterium]
MFAALLTSFFFALSAIYGRRSTLYLGSQRANLARQIVALILLGLWAHTLGQGLHGTALGILFLSGVVGFGLGDWALFEAYPRIGAALTILICQCLAALVAAVTEWLWLGTAMTLLQMAGSAVILVGVALAMAPGHKSDIPAGHRVAGILFGIIAAVGQAWGAVLSRYAFHRAQETGFSLDGITAAYQRLWGGVLSITLLLILRQIIRHWRPPKEIALRPNWKQGWPWILANAVTGAALGVSCYQWALKSTPSAIVLPIVATTPLIVMAIEFAFEGVRPPRRAVIGAVLAVGGVVVLVLNG